MPPPRKGEGLRARLADQGAAVGGAATIGPPSLSLVFCTDQEPPGAPERSGSMVILSSVPGGKDLADQPSRDRPPGAPPSRFQTVVPSPSLTCNRMKVCGLVNLNSLTVPTSSIGCSWSNIANEWCADTVPPKPTRVPAASKAVISNLMRVSLLLVDDLIAADGVCAAVDNDGISAPPVGSSFDKNLTQVRYTTTFAIRPKEGAEGGRRPAQNSGLSARGTAVSLPP